MAKTRASREKIVSASEKYIPGYENLYSVTIDGRIWSHKRNIFLKPYPANKGYLHVRLYKNNARRDFKVHRLVAISFIARARSKTQVNHKDGNKRNNHMTNLEWVTNRENQDHATENGFLAYGEKIGKLTEREVREIRILLLEGYSHRKVAGIYNVAHGTIGNISRQLTWKRTK